MLNTHQGAGDTWYLDLYDDEIKATLKVDPKDAVLCEVPFGSVLFLNNQIPHRSLNNTSNKIRWSFDLRWQRPDQPNGFGEGHGYHSNIDFNRLTELTYRQRA